MKKILLSLSMIISGLSSFAQVINDFDYAASKNTYVKLPKVPETILATSFAGFNDDSYFTNIPIGFSFRLGDSIYTKVNIAPDGYVWFGNAPVVTNNSNTRTRPLSQDLGIGPVLAPMATLIHESLVTGNDACMLFKTQGVAPLRTFTVEWRDVATIDHIMEERLSFQLILHESHNYVEFKYDTMLFEHLLTDSVEIGIRGYLNNDVVRLSNETTQTWSNFFFANAPGYFCELSSTMGPQKGQSHMLYDDRHYLALVKPNEEDTFESGEEIEIKVSAFLADQDSFTVYFSSDSGATYSVIAEDTTFAGGTQEYTFSFEAPDVDSEKCFVKVVAVGSQVSDSNDVAFTITRGTTGLTNADVRSLKVYPNPATDRVSFSGDGLSFHAQAEIYDITGRKLKSERVAPHTSMDVSGLTEGYYLLRITDGDHLYTGRFFINR